MANKGVFDVTLVRFVPKTKEVEPVGIFENLRGQPSLRGGQAVVEVGEGRPLAQVQPAADLAGQGVARPRLGHRLPGVPGPLFGVVYLGQQGHDMEPRQLVSTLLTKLAAGAFLGEELHVFEVGTGQPLHIGEGGAQIGGEAVDDLGAPALAGLAVKDVAAKIVVELNLLGIGGQNRALPGAGDAALEFGQPTRVVDRK